MMGRYIDNILQPGEQVRYSTTIHGIIYLPGLLCWLAAVACLFASGILVPMAVALFGASALLAVIGAVLVFRAWFRRWTTEVDVTTMRVVEKEGFIQRRTFEISLDKVESVDVDQSIMGRVFDYGDVTIRGVGEGIKRIKMIGAPLQFRNYITTH